MPNPIPSLEEPELETLDDIQRHRRKLPRGYSLPSQLRGVVGTAHTTRFGRTVAAAVLDHLAIYAFIASAVAAARLAPIEAAVPITLISVVGLGRQFRALECLVHEGSHYNWHRHRRRLNDLSAQVLAAFPTGAKVEDYRAGHLLHHGRFASGDDPDCNRYRELDIEGIDRQNLFAFMRDLLVRLPRYQAGWLRTVSADPEYMVVPIAWAVLFCGVPIGVLFGGISGAIACITWVLGYWIALPIIRFLGESSEHVYREGLSEFDATVSNIGRWQRYLIHPHNDGYHTVHHLWPGVPHHALRELHNALLSGDPVYSRTVRFRKRLLQDSQRGCA
jgi:fatty acid desaturase